MGNKKNNYYYDTSLFLFESVIKGAQIRQETELDTQIIFLYVDTKLLKRYILLSSIVY